MGDNERMNNLVIVKESLMNYELPPTAKKETSASPGERGSQDLWLSGGFIANSV
jgi:hypothetical protein